MKTLCIRLSIAAAALALAGSASAVPTLLDGSFEMPAITSGTQLGGGAGWTPTYDTSGKGVYIASSTNSFLGQTAYGNQFLTLNQGTADSQAVSGFAIGTSYTVIAYFADLLNGASPALTISLAPAVGLALSQSYTAPQSGGFGYGQGTNIPFVKATYTFLATATSYTLTLTNTSGTPGTIAVDNVSVPEPSSFVALFLGLGVVGVAAAKLRKQRAA